MTPSPDPETTVTGYLVCDHARLELLLAEASAQVRAGDLAEARRVLDRFAAGLRRHIRLEDELLFPVFERLTGMERGPTEIMRDEHREIEGHLARMLAALDARDPGTYAGERLALVAVLEDHDEKEEAIVYPLTDASLEEGARARLVADLRAFR